LDPRVHFARPGHDGLLPVTLAGFCRHLPFEHVRHDADDRLGVSPSHCEGHASEGVLEVPDSLETDGEVGVLDRHRFGFDDIAHLLYVLLQAEDADALLADAHAGLLAVLLAEAFGSLMAAVGGIGAVLGCFVYIVDLALHHFWKSLENWIYEFLEVQLTLADNY